MEGLPKRRRVDGVDGVDEGSAKCGAAEGRVGDSNGAEAVAATAAAAAAAAVATPSIQCVDAAVELKVSIPEQALTLLQVLLDDVQGLFVFTQGILCSPLTHVHPCVGLC